jgi:hypothetical protein
LLNERGVAINDAGDKVEQKTIEFPPDVTLRLMSLIETTKGTGKTSFWEGVKDGFPACLAVVFADGSTPTIISANLCGTSDDQRADDRIKLLLLVSSVICNLPETAYPIALGPGRRH